MQMEPRNARGGENLRTEEVEAWKGRVEEGSFRAPFIAVTKLKISIQF